MEIHGNSCISKLHFGQLAEIHNNRLKFETDRNEYTTVNLNS